MKSAQPEKNTASVDDGGQQPTRWEQFLAYLLRFDRFGSDLLGMVLCVVGALSLLGLSGLTGGAMIEPWSRFWAGWLGFGSYVVAALMIVLGVVIIRRRSVHLVPFQFGRVLLVEVLFFALLALLALVGGQDLERARLGLDGGKVGWGLARVSTLLLPPWLAIAAWLILVLVLLAALWRVGRRLVAWLDAKLLSEEERQQVAVVETPAPASQAVEESHSAVLEPPKARRDERLPPLNLLARELTPQVDEQRIVETGQQIEMTLEEFGLPARVAGYRVGPTVTQFAVEPGFIERPGPDGKPQLQKVRVAQISALARDLALSLSAERVRIEAPVPGQSYVGIEIPNTHHTLVRLRPLLESQEFQHLSAGLPIVLGQNVSGAPVVADLTRMPHLLIAGTTGSGKSVCIAALTTCLVMNNTPGDLRLAMLDPKMVELVRFNGLPHLLGKVETEIERMLGVLRWALNEMDARYRLFEVERVRDLDAYNRKQERAKKEGLPRIVILIDELADLMMSAPEQTESSLVRLAQMARATGIHLVVATQRPSTEVVTGLIKANFPARIAFAVASSTDSRVILDTNGAETLLGKGDMLFLNPEVGAPQRVQGVMVADAEVQRILDFWRKMTPSTEETPPPWEELLKQDDNGDQLVDMAVALVRKTQRASTSLLQRRLRIGYPRAARLMEELEERGVVGPSLGSGRDREVLLPPDGDLDEEEDE